MIDPVQLQSLRKCEVIARLHAKHFYPAMTLLPKQGRWAMCALYAFMRKADDLADSDDTTESKAAKLKAYRASLHRALQGEYDDDHFAGIHFAVGEYSIPVAYLEAAIDGVEMDLLQSRYASFEELHQYCYRVASVVGLCCVHIWGFSGEEALVYAEKAGVAFQLTNILRDLAEDVARDRIYVPSEDLLRFGYSESDLSAHRVNAAFYDLMRFQADRAKQYYAEGERLLPYLHGSGRAVFHLMFKTYRALLDAIQESRFDVFNQRIRISRWKKLKLAASALPAKLGLVH